MGVAGRAVVAGVEGGVVGGGRVSEGLFARASRTLVGGVNSPVRAFGSVGGVPRFIERAEGAWLFDADGNALIDYIGSWGSAIVGHAHGRVVEAMARAARSGSSYGACSRAEVELGERVLERVFGGAAGEHRIRMTSSGTEAVMAALRLARGATGRGLILKFDGCYHGHADQLLVRAGSGLATLGLSDSAGVPESAARQTVCARFNDLESVRSAFAAHEGRIAGVIVEPVAGNMGLVPPAEGFLEGLRSITRSSGSVLIFDEVMTGFRIGRSGAIGRYGVVPDLVTFGKVIGGGLPVGAVAGVREIMELLAPVGPVYQAGTMSGNPLSMSAGLATLGLLDDAAYERLESVSGRLEDGLRGALGGAGGGCGRGGGGGSVGVVQRVGSMLTVFFGVGRVGGFEEARGADHGAFGRFFHGMLDRGAHLPPSGYEAWFVGLGHDESLIDRTVEMAVEAVAEAR